MDDDSEFTTPYPRLESDPEVSDPDICSQSLTDTTGLENICRVVAHLGGQCAVHSQSQSLPEVSDGHVNRLSANGDA